MSRSPVVRLQGWRELVFEQTCRVFPGMVHPDVLRRLVAEVRPTRDGVYNISHELQNHPQWFTALEMVVDITARDPRVYYTLQTAWGSLQVTWVWSIITGWEKTC